MGTNILNLSYIECWLLAAGQTPAQGMMDILLMLLALVMWTLAMHLGQLLGSYGAVVNGRVVR